MYNENNSKHPVLADSQNTIIKPKIEVSIEGTPNDDLLKGGEGDDKIDGEDGDDEGDDEYEGNSYNTNNDPYRRTLSDGDSITVNS